MLTEIQPAKPSSFDAHHAPEKELLADCVHCGFCLPACPTYVLWGEEMDSPRGRIYMMAKAAQGEAPLDQNFRTHMDHCLGCMACMTACPSGVQYNKLIEDTRAQVERNIPRTTRRHPLPQTPLRHVPPSGPPAPHGRPALPLPALRPAISRPQLRPAQACFPHASPPWNRFSRRFPLTSPGPCRSASRPSQPRVVA